LQIGVLAVPILQLATKKKKREESKLTMYGTSTVNLSCQIGSLKTTEKQVSKILLHVEFWIQIILCKSNDVF
jgi:hypothetical protein